MKKIKFLFITLLCLLALNQANAQIAISPFNAYYDGSGTYPGIVKIDINTNQNSLSRTFTAPGTLSPIYPVQSFSISIYKYNTTSGPIMGPIVWTMSIWNNNSLLVNQPYPVYLDDHNGQSWFLYIEKLDVGFRCWIAN